MILAQRLRARRALVLATMAALAVAWLLPGRPVPIYDGVGAPDEPYRYVVVPAGVSSHTLPPTSASVTVPLVAGAASVVQVFTAEQGPQAEADIVGRSLTLPPSTAGSPATSITVTLKPLAPDSGVSGPQIDGNVYLLSFRAGASPAVFANQGSDLLYLRATVGPPPRATFLYRPGPAAPWRPLTTELAGADIYAALIRGAGEYALTRRPLSDTAVSGSPRRSGGGPDGQVLIVGGLGLLFVLAIIAIRLQRRRIAA